MLLLVEQDVSYSLDQSPWGYKVRMDIFFSDIETPESRIQVGQGLVHYKHQNKDSFRFFRNAFVPNHDGKWIPLVASSLCENVRTIEYAANKSRKPGPQASLLLFRISPFQCEGKELPVRTIDELKAVGVEQYGKLMQGFRINRNFPFGHTTTNNPDAAPLNEISNIQRIGMHRDADTPAGLPLGRVVINMNQNGASRYFYLVPVDYPEITSAFDYRGSGYYYDFEKLENICREIPVLRIEIFPYEGWAAIPGFVHDGFTLSAFDNSTMDIFLHRLED